MSRSETSIRLAIRYSWGSRSATGLGGEETADQAADDVECHDQDDQDQCGCPCPVDRVLGREAGLGELVVREDRERGHPPVEWVEVRAVDDADGDKKGSGFADDAGHGQRDAR